MSNRELANGINDIIKDLREGITMSTEQKIFIDIDDILDNFGEIFVYRDIVARKGGFGSLSKVYTALVHPVIAALFNDAVECNNTDMQENLREIVNFRRNDDVGNFVYDSLQQKIFEYVNNPNNGHITVSTNSVLRFATSIIELLTGHIRDIALEFRDQVREQGVEDDTGYIMLCPQCTTTLLPATDTPTMLSIILSYSWVNAG